ncbi:hypothetical protein [Streptomyces sp. CA-132043]
MAEDSLVGDSHAHSMEESSPFTRGKVITLSWLDPSPCSLNLGFPQTS